MTWCSFPLTFFAWNLLCFLDLWVYAAAAKLLQLSPTLCYPIDGSPPGSTIPGALQARILEWVASSFSNAWKWKWKWSRSVVSESLQPMDCSPLGSSVHGMFQARVLEWVPLPSPLWVYTFLQIWKKSVISSNIALVSLFLFVLWGSAYTWIWQFEVVLHFTDSPNFLFQSIYSFCFILDSC